MNNRERKRALFEKMFDGECCVCGEDFYNALDLHHINPNDKEVEISSGSYGKSSCASFDEDLVRAEWEKCICLCANCHRKYHAGHLETRHIADRHAWECGIE